MKKPIYYMITRVTMACHPSGVIVDIVGTEESSNGRSCKKHACCGCVLGINVVVRFRVVQLERPGDKEQPKAYAIAAYHVTEGIDSCKVDFLRRHLLRYKEEYDGCIAQITEVMSDKSDSPSDRAKYKRNGGCCTAVLIESKYRMSTTEIQQAEIQEAKRARTT
jgi:hypothetical protein